MERAIQVFLADDHPLVRAGIRAILESEPGIEVVGEAADGHETLRACEALPPDILLLDLSMPGPAPLEIIQYLAEQCPKVRVLVLTAFDDSSHIQKLMEIGVAGYILKDEGTEAVIQAVQTVAQGATWFSRTVMDKLVHVKTKYADHSEPADLTEREQQILQAIAQGWDNARIAARLHLSEQTVRNYASRVYNKLGLNSRAEAILWALEHGYRHEEPS
jgi:DNA-binding NarL/FixJ family response regulator